NRVPADRRRRKRSVHTGGDTPDASLADIASLSSAMGVADLDERCRADSVHNRQHAGRCGDRERSFDDAVHSVGRRHRGQAMKRVVILGGSGFFGRLIAEGLAAAGVQPIVASRTRGELRIDADNPEDLRICLRPRDLVIDAAGPFQKRSPALINAARTIGFDLIDISDSPDYTAMVYQHEAPIQAAGIRVLPACSALSTVSAAVLKSYSVEEPRRLSAYLVPASRYTANPGTLAS